MLKQITDGVFVHQSELLQNNTIVVQGKTGVLLVDPGITDAEMTCIASDLRELGQPVVVGFSTHPDWDHVLWHAELGEAPRYGTAKNAAFMQEFRAKEDWKAQAAEGLPPEIADEVPLGLFGLITGLPTGTVYLPWDGPKIRIIEHPAHAQGHAALLIEESGVLIAGDMLSDIFFPFIDTGAVDPLGDYLAGLNILKAAAGDVAFVVPGHGSVGEGEQVQGRIELDLTYVQSLLDGRIPADPRVGPEATFGKEWLPGMHEWQAKQLIDKSKQ
jgi:glyoxylase-like metal-dependent hydrolase (beta-lactamase superfamily II)